MAEQEDTTMKEPGPNNLEEAKEYQKQTKIALQKFTERIHSFDRYQHQSAYEFYVHNVLNELLHTDNSYYKKAEIQPMLDTIHDKMCKFVLQPDVVPPQSWGDRSDTKHSKCLLLGGRQLNQLTLIPKPKGSGGTRAATAQVGPANKRNETKRCLPIEASLRPGEAIPW